MTNVKVVDFLPTVVTANFSNIEELDYVRAYKGSENFDQFSIEKSYVPVRNTRIQMTAARYRLLAHYRNGITVPLCVLAPNSPSYKDFCQFKEALAGLGYSKTQNVHLIY